MYRNMSMEDKNEYLAKRKLLIMWLKDIKSRVEYIDDKIILQDAIDIFTEEIDSVED